VFEEGDMANNFYLVAAGHLQVLVHKAGSSDKNEQQELGQLHPGEYFGEGGILTSQPRCASVRCLTPVKLICLGKEDFNMLMEDEGIAGSALSKSHSRRQIENVQTLVQMAANIQGKMRLKVFKDNELICSEGGVGDSMYHVESGELSVHRRAEAKLPDFTTRRVNVAVREKATKPMLSDEPSKGHIVAILKHGDVFGERSLMTGQTRSATVICRSKKCEVNILAKADFLKLAATSGVGLTAPKE
jgi:CRP-like cAMP-binding protein